MNDPLTKKDLYGTPLSTGLWFFAILGTFLIMLYGLEYHPLSDGNHPIYWQLTGVLLL